MSDIVIKYMSIRLISTNSEAFWYGTLINFESTYGLVNFFNYIFHSYFTFFHIIAETYVCEAVSELL